MPEFLHVMIDALPVLLEGLGLTVYLAVVSLALATVIGLISGLMTLSHRMWLYGPARFYVNLIRGTPLLVQILFIYFGLPAVMNVKLSPMVAGVIAISFHIGAYVSEVFRAGIESVDKGQTEAGRSLGMTHTQTMRKIIIPQAVRSMIPPMMNQFIMGVKDTSLLAVIGVAELTQRGQSIYAVNYRAFEILTLVALIYFILTYTLYRLSRVVERKFGAMR
ncbi:amino acid ABC transporter permease [Microbacterium sp. W4I20]|uniref:amino acid ABC transporter permease n=1 Tax=Microbacterium sp. W4I20 TaxID=3042262 RepID=UPI00278B2106|nr:amino acid ABC transporter permease [Microbacterium sp. W4I20]MDQ0726609.1 glutamine transport system permease protein [Microbacterium sp. W4I20]